MTRNPGPARDEALTKARQALATIEIPCPGRTDDNRDCGLWSGHEGGCREHYRGLDPDHLRAALDALADRDAEILRLGADLDNALTLVQNVGAALDCRPGTSIVEHARGVYRQAKDAVDAEARGIERAAKAAEDYDGEGLNSSGLRAYLAQLGDASQTQNDIVRAIRALTPENPVLRQGST